MIYEEEKKMKGTENEGQGGGIYLFICLLDI